MKPIVLTMQAFGPFADKQLIDFRKLGEKSFFLIHGATGSGKTSILDGICFALFGDSSGGEREARQMRSHHADVDTLTEVSFDFSLGEKRYRVRRSPDQMRKSKRGDGETKQNATAELSRVESTGETDIETPITSGWSKVNAAVVDLLGFESTQFRQVIMLPQGKFREFLMSGTNDREKILQTLFGTEVYKRIEEALKLAAKRVAEESEKVRMQQKTLLDQASVESLTLLETQLEQQTTDLASRQSNLVTATAAATIAEDGLNHARLVSTKFEEADSAQAALQARNAEQPGWVSRRAQLAAARNAATITPYEVALVELGEKLDLEVKRGAKLGSELELAANTKLTADAALVREKANAPVLERVIVRCAEFGALVSKVASLAEVRAEHAAASKENVGCELAEAAAQKTLKEAVEAQQSLDIKIQNHRVQAAGLDGQRETHARLKSEHERATALEVLVQQQVVSAARVATLGSGLAAIQAQLADARTRYGVTQQTWIAGQAARLASALVDGQACAVCGSHEHPAPAHLDGALVPDATLKSAEAAVSKCEIDLREAERILSAEVQVRSVLEARISESRTALGEAAQLSAAGILEQVKAAHGALTLSETATRELQSLEAKRPGADQATKRAELALKTAHDATQLAQAKLQQLVGTLTEREGGIPAELADPKALQIAIQATESQRIALKQALDMATAAAGQAAIEITETTARVEANKQSQVSLSVQRLENGADLEQRLQAGGFVDLGHYHQALMDESKMAALEAGIQAFEQSLAAARERQNRAAAATSELIRPDLAGLLVAHEQAKAAQLGASNAVRDALSKLDETTRFVDSLKRLQATYETLETRHGVLKKVSDVATGSNAQRMSLQRYVLATLLEEVVVATTLRLRLMSRGRYEMRRKVEAGDQRAAAGLDLEIFDQYTGTTRAVGTLSGGESFLAALALALGLSDIVQSYSGGIRLDAIFVDEGFGSLDPEALDHAIRALKDLQQAGRMVGIISHVAELKECIDARLELTATQTGSQARFVV